MGRSLSKQLPRMIGCDINVKEAGDRVGRLFEKKKKTLDLKITEQHEY